jgi:two-component system response regulator AlgR
MLRIFIADDEPPARDRLRALLSDLEADIPNQVVGEATNGLEALERLPGSGADIVLLDIRMPGMDGIEVARNLARQPNAPAVVFVTSFEAHALVAFELHALDYLLKPVRAARLADAIRRAVTAGPTPEAALDTAAGHARAFLPVVERNRIVLVRVAEVLYFKAEQKYVVLRTAEREHLIEEPLIALEREFAESFVRIHRNCLVARNAVRGFERSGVGDEDPRWSVVLAGVAERLLVSRRQWPAVRAVLAEPGCGAE